MKIVAFIISILIFSFPYSVYAQNDQKYYSIEDIQSQSYIANPQFEFMGRNAMRYKSETFDFTRFRRYYAQSRQYDPLGEKTLNRMWELYYDVLNNENPDIQEAALDSYELLILEHMAHLGVIYQALTFARDDARFGDVDFLVWMRNGIIKDLLISGDGYTLRGAYDIITLAEETALMDALRVRPFNSVANKEYKTYYNMHDVVRTTKPRKQAARTSKTHRPIITKPDPRMNKPQSFTLFVNTTFPMRFLDALQQMEQGLSIDLRKR